MIDSVAQITHTNRPHQSVRWRRLLLLLALSVLLHLLFLGWGTNRLSWPIPHAETQPILITELLPPAALPVAKIIPPAPVAKPIKRINKPKPAAEQPKPEPEQEPEPEPIQQSEPVLSVPSDDTQSNYSVPTEPLAPIPSATVGISRSTPTTPSSTVAAQPAPTPTAESSATVSAFNAPPSVQLNYDVQAIRDQQMVYGHGSIAWHTDGNTYQIDGDAGILIFSVLNFRSEGTMESAGIDPLLYTEKRFRKSATNTHFHRERQQISFSATTLTYPRQGGEQDRASVIWQLAGIGRGDPSRFAANTDIDFFVAGPRDAEPWRMHVIGQETISLDDRPVLAWHVVRLPREGSYQQKIDVWLAPELEWYPVKLRYTDTNGEYLDLLLTSLKRTQSDSTTQNENNADNNTNPAPVANARTSAHTNEINQ
ncbi:MAG: DUF3108 domain-containing protein [Herbaspirillum sp.]